MGSTEPMSEVHAARSQNREKEINLGSVERWLSMFGGGALVIYGLRHLGFWGIAGALAGGMLVRRGATGHCPIYHRFGVTTAGGKKEKQRIEIVYGTAGQRVEEQGEEPFKKKGEVSVTEAAQRNVEHPEDTR